MTQADGVTRFGCNEVETVARLCWFDGISMIRLRLDLSLNLTDNFSTISSHIRITAVVVQWSCNESNYQNNNNSIIVK